MKLLAAVAVLLVAGACGSESEPADGADSGTAETAVVDLLTALDEGSCDDARALVVTPDALDCGQVETLRGSYSDDGVDLGTVVATAGPVTDGSVTVTVDLGTDDPDETWQAERVDGRWRVLFDSEE